MLNCKEVVDGASDYLDRRLPLTGRVSFWLHLSLCAVCRSYVRQLERTVLLLRRLGEDERPFPEPLHDAVMAAFDAARREQSGS